MVSFIHLRICEKLSREEGEKKKIIPKVLNSGSWEKDGSTAGGSEGVKAPLSMAGS